MQSDSQTNQQPSEDTSFPEWNEVLALLKTSDLPLNSILTGASAFIRGDYCLIRCDNPTFPQFIKIPIHASALRNAIETVTGKKYKLGIKKSEQTLPSRDPLADLVKKINS